MRTYSLDIPDKFLSDAAARNPIFVKDAGGLPGPDLDLYLKKGYAMFAKRIQKLVAKDILGDGEEKELRFMLEALIAAKRILEERRKR